MVRFTSPVFALLLTTVLAAAEPTPAFASEWHSFDISATDASSAVRDFGRQAGVEILASGELLKGKQLRPVSGDYSTEKALTLLLADTGLTHRYVGDRGVVLVARGDKSAEALEVEDARPAAKTSGMTRVAQNATDNATSTQAADAQQKNAAPDSARRDDSARPDEVVVTATKRATSLQETSMSISVLGGQDIERRNISGMDDYLRTMPGVTITDQGVGFNTITMRGITTLPSVESIVNGSTVGIYFGEVPVVQSETLGNPDLKLVDMERVEVLRGPQGTLYGASSMGGTLRNIPRAPNLQKIEGSVEADYSNTGGFGGDNNKIQGVFNLPLLKDKLALRALGYRFEDAGFVKNVGGDDPGIIAQALSANEPWRARNSTSGDTEVTGFRVSALWQPTEALDVAVNYMSQEGETLGKWGGYIDLDKGEYANAYLHPGTQVGDESMAQDIDVLNAVIEYDFGWAKLVSSSSRVDSLSEVHASIIPSWSLIFTYAPEQFTQEIRLASQLKGPLQFIVGGFYDDIETIRDGTHINPIPGAAQDLGFYFLNSQVKQTAVFGELAYDLTDKLNVSVGARAFKYDRTDEDLTGGTLFGDTVGTNRSANESDSTFKANITFKATQDALLYAMWSEGFRLGRGNLQPPRSLCDVDNDGLLDGTSASIEQDQVKSDTLDNYEVGAKLSFLDNRLTVNAAAFRIDWKGLPLAARSPSCSFQIIANAGEAVSQGLELDSQFYVTRALRLSLSSSYIDAELSRDAPSLGGEKGDPLPGSPKFKADFGVQYDFSLAGREAFVAGDFAYVGEFFDNLQETPASRAGNYREMNLRTGMAFGNVDVALFVRNLTDDDGFTYALTRQQTLRLRPRTVGVNLKYRF